MDSERWQEINGVLDAVLNLPPGQQHAYLDTHYPDDPALRREVLDLLEAHGQAQSFLEQPARDMAAPLMAPDTDQNDPLVGQMLDGYRIDGVLGRGGMGIVYEAFDEGLRRTVALKVIDPALARDPAFLRRFRDEAEALGRINSPYIVTVHSFRRIEDRLLLDMEYVDGGTVADLIEQGPIPWEQALPLIRQMLTALEQAHSVGVIHRDIKPQNIMITGAGVVKVTDFGLAKVSRDVAATMTQGVAGTPLYMSPEQVRGLGGVDARTDLFSAGMTIYKMLAGTLPIDPESGYFAITQAIVNEAFPPVTHYNPNVPAPVAEVVARALAKDPADRFADAATMLAAFEALETLGEPARKAPPPVVEKQEAPPEPPEPKRRPWPFVAAGVLGGARAGLGWFMLDGFGDPPADPPPTFAVRTVPAAATVFLDGRNLGPTPLDVPLDGAAERVSLRFEKAGFLPLDTTLQVATIADTLVLNLAEAGEASPASAFLTVSAPSGVTVAVAGENCTPGQPCEVVPGAKEISCSAGGRVYETLRETVAAGATGAVSCPAPPAESGGTVTPPPVRTATLTLRAEPSGATLRVAGETCQPGTPCRVSAGRKRITCSYNGRDAATTLTLPADASETVTCYGQQNVTVNVRNADTGSELWGTIYLNGQPAKGSVAASQLSSTSLTLDAGTHEISVRRQLDQVLTPPQRVVVEPSFTEPERKVLVFQIRTQ